MSHKQAFRPTLKLLLKPILYACWKHAEVRTSIMKGVKPKHLRTRRYLDSGIYDGLTAFSELEQRIKGLPETERGDAFEVFAEAYLATQKINQAKEIWPETKLPPRLIKKFNLGKRKGVGVDGIYETTAGHWYAYQVKFRSSQNLTFNEVSPFYGITEAFDQRVLITNCNRLASQIDDRPNAFCVRGNDLARLERSDFEGMLQWLTAVVVKVAHKTPDPHQQEALDTILPALKENDRVSAIMACGTGKTLVTLWAAEKQGCKTLLVLVPSLALVRQTLHEWLAETKWSKLAYLCVCSDPSVARGADEIIVRPSELDFPVSTDSKNVAEFISRPFDGVKVVFSTYQSAQVVANGMDKDFSFDFAIFDEAHKTAGRQGKKNSLALDDTNLPIGKRLFVTATPRHYSPIKRTKEGEQAVLYSMDDPSVYGPLDKRYELSFADAARRKIICDYKIIISEITYEAVTNELLRRGEVIVEGDTVRARQVANQLAIKNAIEKFCVKKIFSFHGRVKSAESFTSDRSEGVNSIIPDLPAYHVHGKMKAADREMIMDEFSAAATGIVSNARCLTEGVDVPAVDMVAFMSPKKSKIDIVQATGRAMRRPRKKSNKKIGYIFIPLYIEQAKGETEEEAIKRLGFEELADVLNAMKEQDDVLVDILREMREELGRTGGYDDSRFREKVEVIGELVALDILRDSIATMCVERLGSIWDERYGQLLNFFNVYGHLRVGPTHDKTLASYVRWLRQKHDLGELEKDKVKALNAIEFDWETGASRWDRWLDFFREFKDRTGKVEAGRREVHFEGRDLRGWIHSQRTAYRRGTLTKQRVSRLEAAGFVWNVIDEAWETSFEALRDWIQINGAESTPRPQSLKIWAATQRQNRRNGILSEKNIGNLDEIGFIWDHIKHAWQRRLSILKAHLEAGGELLRGNDISESDRKISNAIGNLRADYKKGKLTDLQIKQLQEVGFILDPFESAWLKMYDDLCRCMDLGKKPSRVLYTWCSKQRKVWKNGQLASDKIEMLDAIDFNWDPSNTLWAMRFHELQEFAAQNEHTNVPLRYTENPSLGSWVSTQRVEYRKGTLSDERIRKLESIDFLWNLK